MPKRLPSPASPVGQRCVLDESEMPAVEDAAHAARLSVASWIRVALLDAAANSEERLEAWNALAAELIAAGARKKKPGRPPKKKPPKA